jgi:peptide/nickel transport system substrate-binding protein
MAGSWQSGNQQGYWQKSGDAFAKRLSRRRVLGAGLIAGAGFGTFILGCGGNSSTTSKSTTAAGASPSPAASAKTAAKRGGTLTTGFSQDASTLDPQVGVSGFDANYVHTIYDSLVGYDQQFKTDPNRSLASSFEIPDNLTVVFHLRDATFHDGTPVDAAAIKWNIDRILTPSVTAQNRGQLLILDSVVAQDPKTVVFKLKSPAADIISTLGSRGSLIVSPTAVAKYGDQFGSNPVGSGPFRFKSRVTGSSVTVERNPNYWAKDAAGTQLPYLDTLQMKYIQDDTARAAALRAGDVQFIDPGAKDIAAFRKDSSNKVVSLSGGAPGHTLQYNYGLPPMDDQNLRLAIAWAVDSQAIVDGAFFGEASVAKGGFWPPQLWVYQDLPDHPLLDVTKAKAFLAKSKYAGESIKLTAFTVPAQVQAVQIVQSNLKQIGVNSEIGTGDIATIAAAFFGKKSAHIFSSNFGLYPEPDHIAENVFSSQGSQNAGALSGAGQDKDIDDLVAQGRATYDLTQRKTIYTNLNELSVQRAKTALVMVYQKMTIVGSSKLANLELAFIADGWYRFHEVWLNG